MAVITAAGSRKEEARRAPWETAAAGSRKGEEHRVPWETVTAADSRKEADRRPLAAAILMEIRILTAQIPAEDFPEAPVQAADVREKEETTREEHAEDSQGEIYLSGRLSCTPLQAGCIKTCYT